MKWPNTITLMRHGESAYNVLRRKKIDDPLYIMFKQAFDVNPTSPETNRLAELVREKFALGISDYATPLTGEGWKQARTSGENIAESGAIPKPDIVLCSPYLRTRQTLEGISLPMALERVKVVMERRVREKEHGLKLLYNDHHVFDTFHPDQRELEAQEGDYFYRPPQGENVPDVQERIQSITETIIREYAGANVLIVTHHITILAIRANFERLSPEQFLALDEEEKPVNCGVTMYTCNPKSGKDGKLELTFYNKKFY